MISSQCLLLMRVSPILQNYRMWLTEFGPASPASWQTLFWTLVPLATNIMTQPSGRVFSISSSYCIYLRSSPILSFLDALTFLLRTLFTPCLLPISLHKSLKMTIHERYQENENTNEESEGLQSLEKQTWLRWVFFLVGALGPSIKLMALQGVPWTKTWGAMFLFAFLVIEVAALISRRSTTPAVQLSLDAEQGAAEPSTAETRTTQGFEALDTIMFTIGAITHCCVLVWALLDPWILRVPFYASEWESEEWKPKEPTSVADLLFVFSVWNICIACMFYILYFFWKRFGDDFRGRGKHPECRVFYSFTGIVLVAGVGFCLYSALQFPVYILRDSALFFLSLASIPAFAWAIKKLSILRPSLGETLLGVADGDSPRVDGDAANALTLFVANLVISALWYWLRYNPEGMVNPSWTGVFG